MGGLIWVGLGGGLGAMARYSVGEAVIHHFVSFKFPLVTFFINFGGCLLIGILASLADRYNISNSGVKLFLITGFLGGFTTFSAFGLETLVLVRRGDLVIAGLNIVASVLCCIIAVWIGIKLSLLLPPVDS